MLCSLLTKNYESVIKQKMQRNFRHVLKAIQDNKKIAFKLFIDPFCTHKKRGEWRDTRGVESNRIIIIVNRELLKNENNEYKIATETSLYPPSQHKIKFFIENISFWVLPSHTAGIDSP